jgi:RecA-family ATPase
MPPITWLIRDFVPDCSFGMLWAKQESFKSFLALSMACSVATGKDWLGLYPVSDPGPVCYIAAEGKRGIKPRIEAWERQQKIKANNLWTVPEPVMFDQVPALLQLIEKRKCAPRLVVVDTYSRCLAGEDENSSSSAERVLAALEKFRIEYDASVLIVHHCDKAANWPRGSYAVQCAMDYEYQLTREEGSMVANLVCRKQKDSARPRPMTLLARSLGESLVLEKA